MKHSHFLHHTFYSYIFTSNIKMSSDDSLSSSCSSGSESSSDDSDDDAETMLSLSIKKLRSNSYRYYYFQQGLNQEDVAKLPRPKRKRKKKRVVFYLSEDGTKKVLVPEMSWWYLCYVKCPAVDDNTFLKRFRRRFRLPYHFSQNHQVPLLQHKT